MATYFIVADGTFPLGVNEIEAGSTISVVTGDIFIFEDDADKNTTFEAAGGEPTPVDFSVNFNTTSTASNYNVTFDTDLNPDITVADNVDISNVTLNATNADSTTLTLGDGSSIRAFDGSSSGTDNVTIGDTVSINDTFDTSGGDDTINIGSNNIFDGDF